MLFLGGEFRVHYNPSAVLADDELLVRRNLNEPLRNDLVETAAAGISVVNGNDSKVIVLALTDPFIGAHGPGINDGGALVPLVTEGLLLLCGRLYDVVKLVFLHAQIVRTDSYHILDVLEIRLEGKDFALDLTDVLFRYLTEKFLVLDFLVDGIVLAAVGDIVELLVVLGDLGVTVDDVLLVLGDSFIVAVDLSGKACGLAFESRYLLLQSCDL